MPHVAGSEYFDWKEFAHSESHPELVRPIPASMTGNVEQLVIRVLDPMRRILGRPIKILSCYRPPALNEAVGGSPTSQHLKAEAVDFTTLRIQNVFESMMGRVPQFLIGQCIYYPEQHFIHCALPSVRYPTPSYHIHAPKFGYLYYKLESVDRFRSIMEHIH